MQPPCHRGSGPAVVAALRLFAQFGQENYSLIGTKWLKAIRTISNPIPIPRLQPINFFSIGRSGSAVVCDISSFKSGGVTALSPGNQLAKGGLNPAKNNHEIKSPTQITNPNRLTK